MTTLHISQLASACSEQRQLFKQLFGNFVEVTPEACLAVADKFDWGWAASHLLPAPALVEYDKVRAAARAECDKVRAAAWAEYDKVRAAAWAEYDKVRAVAFGRLYSAT